MRAKNLLPAESTEGLVDRGAKREAIQLADLAARIAANEGEQIAPVATLESRIRICRRNLRHLVDGIRLLLTKTDQ